MLEVQMSHPLCVGFRVNPAPSVNRLSLLFHLLAVIVVFPRKPITILSSTEDEDVSPRKENFLAIFEHGHPSFEILLHWEPRRGISLGPQFVEKPRHRVKDKNDAAAVPSVGTANGMSGSG
jgi:hypothetical protein